MDSIDTTTEKPTGRTICDGCLYALMPESSCTNTWCANYYRKHVAHEVGW